MLNLTSNVNVFVGLQITNLEFIVFQDTITVHNRPWLRKVFP